MRNSIIILSKDINIDKSYNNVLSYSESDMLNLLQSENHLINKAIDYSFINKNSNNEINVSFTYEECLQANYIAYQNKRYSNKWFFAFIDEINYVSEKTTKIKFSIDVWSTWFDYWESKPCFVIQEMVNDDSIGKHTVPENLQLGEYIVNSHYIDGELQNFKIVIASTESPSGEGIQYGGIYNGVYSGVKYYTYDAENTTKNLQSLADKNKIEAVSSLFLAPNFVIPQDVGGVINESYSVNNYEFNIEKLTSINGYVPRNNKLFVYPFTYLILSNNQGANALLHFEKFSDDVCKFRVVGALTPGCSIKCYPLNYNNIELAIEEGVNLGKYPQLNWATDNFTNWLTQNGLNVATNLIKDSIRLFAGDMTGAIEIAQSVQSVVEAEKVPPQSYANINSGDVTTSMHQNTFNVYSMSIKEEYAKIIDDYFNRYGYIINRTKIPNIKTRPIFNYIKIASNEDIGYSYKQISIPSQHMEIINNICRNGVSIWHNHSNIGNYTLNNKKMD